MKYIYLFIILFLITKLSISQNIGEPAPDFTLRNTANVEFMLSQQKGKVVAVFIFGYACPSCIAISPDVQSKIANQFKVNEDFIMIGIDAWDGTTAQVNNFVDKTNIEFEALQQGSKVAQSWGTSYDRLVIIDREGNLAFKGAGLVSSHIDQAISALETTLNKTQTSLFRIEKSNENKFSLFPNPVIDNLSVNFNILESQKVEMIIYDLSGKTVYQNNEYANDGSNSISLNVSSFKSGVHFLQLNTENSSLTKRFIIK